jgi:hypothetical protein
VRVGVLVPLPGWWTGQAEKLVDRRVGEVVADDPTITLSADYTSGPEEAEGLRDRVRVLVDGDSQVGDADRTGCADTEEDAESGGIAEEAKALGPNLNGGGIQAADGGADPLLVDDAAVAPVGGNEVHNRKSATA